MIVYNSYKNKYPFFLDGDEMEENSMPEEEDVKEDDKPESPQQEDEQEKNLEEQKKQLRKRQKMVKRMIRQSARQESIRNPIKCKVTVDPKILVPAEFLTLPQVVQVRGEFCEEMAEAFAHDFHAAEQSGQEIIPIVIDSFGGDVYSLMSMIDIINNSSATVATIVMGKAMSCGAVLLTCGDKGLRFASPNSTIMVHQAWTPGASGNPDEIKVTADELARVSNKILEIMSLNCDHPKDYFAKKVAARKNTDWFLTANEALKHKIVNKLSIPEFEVVVNMETRFLT